MTNSSSATQKAIPYDAQTASDALVTFCEHESHQRQPLSRFADPTTLDKLHNATSESSVFWQATTTALARRISQLETSCHDKYKSNPSVFMQRIQSMKQKAVKREQYESSLELLLKSVLDPEMGLVAQVKEKSQHVASSKENYENLQYLEKCLEALVSFQDRLSLFPRWKTLNRDPIQVTEEILILKEKWQQLKDWLDDDLPVMQQTLQQLDQLEQDWIQSLAIQWQESIQCRQFYLRINKNAISVLKACQLLLVESDGIEQFCERFYHYLIVPMIKEDLILHFELENDYVLVQLASEEKESTLEASLEQLSCLFELDWIRAIKEKWSDSYQSKLTELIKDFLFIRYLPQHPTALLDWQSPNGKYFKCIDSYSKRLFIDAHEWITYCDQVKQQFIAHRRLVYLTKVRDLCSTEKGEDMNRRIALSSLSWTQNSFSPDTMSLSQSFSWTFLLDQSLPVERKKLEQLLPSLLKTNESMVQSLIADEPVLGCFSQLSVSRLLQLFIDLMLSVVEEMKASDHRVLYELLLKDMISLYLLFQSRRLSSSPSLSMSASHYVDRQVLNLFWQCVLLPQLPQSFDRVLQWHSVTRQFWSLTCSKHLQVMNSLLDAKMRQLEMETKPLDLSEIKSQFHQWREDWQNILPASIYLKSMQQVLDPLLDSVLERVCHLDDIGVEQSQQWSLFCQSLLSLIDDLFISYLEPLSTDLKQWFKERLLKHWKQCQDLCFLLDARLAEWVDAVKQGRLQVVAEVKDKSGVWSLGILLHLLKALFADTALRRQSIATITEWVTKK